MTQLQDAHDVLRYDVDAEFLRDISIGLGWAYTDLFREIEMMQSIPESCKIETFGRLRGTRAVDVLVRACKKHGVPFGFRKLTCNGQQKLMIKAGRVLLIQEPMLQLTERPRTSDYKLHLARTHGLAQQLELDLGDIPNRILDWSGQIFAVLLHGSAGSDWSEVERGLGGAFLAIPNYDYSSWAMRLDLQRLAATGFDAGVVGLDPKRSESPFSSQTDKVQVRLKSLPEQKGKSA